MRNCLMCGEKFEHHFQSSGRASVVTLCFYLSASMLSFTAIYVMSCFQKRGFDWIPLNSNPSCIRACTSMNTLTTHTHTHTLYQTPTHRQILALVSFSFSTLQIGVYHPLFPGKPDQQPAPWRPSSSILMDPCSSTNPSATRTPVMLLVQTIKIYIMRVYKACVFSQHCGSFRWRH